MSLKDLVRKVLSPIVAWNLVGMLVVGIAAFVGLKLWMGSYTMHGEGVDVPEVKGMMLSDATYALDRAELVTVVVDSTYVRDRPVGSVLEQKPAAGSRVKSGREVYLTINQKMMPTAVIPNLADNCSRREAEARLRALGFRIGPIEFTPGDADWVYELKANGRPVVAGERVSKDVPIVLVVGNNSQDMDEDDDMDDAFSDDGSFGEDAEYEEEL